MLLRFAWFGGIVLAVLAITRWRRPALGRRVAVVAWCAAIVMLVAQVLRDERLTYPFVSWHMYSDRFPPAGYSRWVTLESGARIYPFDLISPLEPRTFAYRVDQLITLCRCNADDPVIDQVIERMMTLHQRKSGWTVDQVGVELVIVRPVVPTERNMRRYTWRRRLPH